jgi:hypothetical protein
MECRDVVHAPEGKQRDAKAELGFRLAASAKRSYLWSPVPSFWSACAAPDAVGATSGAAAAGEWYANGGAWRRFFWGSFTMTMARRLVRVTPRRSSVDVIKEPFREPQLDEQCLICPSSRCHRPGRRPVRRESGSLDC